MKRALVVVGLFSLLTACSDTRTAPFAPVATATLGSLSGGACGSTSVALIAGQHHTAGSVTIENDEDDLTVTITTSGGWTMSATHVAAATSLAGIPRNKPGNPVPGQFPSKASHAAGTTSHSVTYSLASLGATVGSNVIVAVHAEVSNGSQSEGAWGDGTRFVTSTWAMYSSHTVADCGFDVLVLSNNGFDNNVLINGVTPLLPDATFTSRMTWDPSALTGSYLSQFDVVMLSENGLTGNAQQVGNAIASYINNGGNVVISTFYWQSRSDNPIWNWQGWGTLETLDPLQKEPGIDAGTHWSKYEYRFASLDAGSIVAHPLTAGVTSLQLGCYPNGMAAKPGTSVVASYANGAPLLAYLTHGGGQRVVAVAAFISHPAYCFTSGDFFRMFANAAEWAAGGSNPVPFLMANTMEEESSTATPPSTPKIGGTGGENR